MFSPNTSVSLRVMFDGRVKILKDDEYLNNFQQCVIHVDIECPEEESMERDESPKLKDTDSYLNKTSTSRQDKQQDFDFTDRKIQSDFLKVEEKQCVKKLVAKNLAVRSKRQKSMAKMAAYSQNIGYEESEGGVTQAKRGKITKPFSVVKKEDKQKISSFLEEDSSDDSDL